LAEKRYDDKISPAEFILVFEKGNQSQPTETTGSVGYGKAEENKQKKELFLAGLDGY